MSFGRSKSIPGRLSLPNRFTKPAVATRLKVVYKDVTSEMQTDFEFKTTAEGANIDVEDLQRRATLLAKEDTLLGTHP